MPLFGRCEQHEVSALFSLGILAYAVSLTHHDQPVYIYIYIQGVPGGMCETLGECSLC